MRVSYWRWLTSVGRRLVIGVYGLAEHNDRYVNFAEYLARDNFDYCMMDLRGHGRTVEKTEKSCVDGLEDFI